MADQNDTGQFEFYADKNIPVRVGFITAEDVDINREVDAFEKELNSVIKNRKHELSKSEDAFRKTVRDMLRNGVYKPTGRGKPASEYLLKAAQKDNFPRINSVVDINNYISLKYLVPASQWDLDRVKCEKFILKLGEEGESLVFNQSGQTIDIQDLVSVYGYNSGDNVKTPFLNPIKDSLNSKTGDDTRNVGAVVYLPALETEGDPEWPSLEEVVEEYKYWLSQLASGSVQKHYPEIG